MKKHYHILSLLLLIPALFLAIPCSATEGQEEQKEEKISSTQPESKQLKEVLITRNNRQYGVLAR
jgi:hypothetical protein